MPARGTFIALEGPDGSGKTTQAALLAERLRASGRVVLAVREPGGTELGERVRSMLLDPASGDICPRGELLLFMAARAQLVEDKIAPALARGEVVLSDRFLLSTLVYQGVAGGVPLDEIRAVGQAATGGVLPELNLVLDVPAETGFARIERAHDRMELKGLDYHRRIRQGYLDAAALVGNATVLDGTRPREAVAEDIWREVSRVLR